jgi:hypothetical protein
MEIKSDSNSIKSLHPHIGTKVEAKQLLRNSVIIEGGDIEEGTTADAFDKNSCVDQDGRFPVHSFSPLSVTFFFFPAGGIPLPKGCKHGLVMVSPHVLSGYRIGHAPADLVASMLTLHNETGNIWTHLLGGILYAYFWTTNILTVEGVTWVDVRFSQFMLALGMVMFVCSTMYHTMKDNWLDKESTSYFLQFDFVGVSILFGIYSITHHTT